jgi:zinc finger protein
MRTCTLNIPHFKEIVLMAFTCDECGYHNGEVMVSGGISPQARRLTCRVASDRDLKRELIKSELAAVKFAELGLELMPGTLGGKFTTIEGLLRDIKVSLKDKNPFASGDSVLGERDELNNTIAALERYEAGQEPFTMVIDDPLAKSHIQDFEDTLGSIVIEDYPRTPEQDEALGIDGMLTEAVETPEGIRYQAPTRS